MQFVQQREGRGVARLTLTSDERDGAVWARRCNADASEVGAFGDRRGDDGNAETEVDQRDEQLQLGGS